MEPEGEGRVLPRRGKNEDLLLEAKKFFDAHKKEVGASIRKDEGVVHLSHAALASYSIDLAEKILSSPEETLAILELALEDSYPEKKMRVRLLDLPKGALLKIRDIRAKHLDSMVWIEGIVRQASEVRPQVVNAKFECPNCGAILSVLQIERKFREPSRCSCGWKGTFKLLSKEMIDAQRLSIEESPDSLEGGEQPRRINVFLQEDLVDPRMESRTTPGSKVRIFGVLKEVPMPLQTGAISTRFDIAIEANNTIPIEESFDDLEMTEEDERQIKELAADPKVFDRLAKSIAPSIYGFEKIKESVLLQLFGGVKKTKSDGGKTRGDIHVLLVGDPGVAKSVLLKMTSTIAPKGRYVSGKAATAAGLCVSPRSRILTNPGGIENIQNLVERRLKNPLEYREGVWKEDNIVDVKIQSMSPDLKIHSKNPESIWKLKSPSKVYEILLESGKKIELTGNTQLFVLEDGETKWNKSSMLKIGDYVATPRKLIGGEEDMVYFVDLIKSNPVVHNVKNLVSEVAIKLKEKYGSVEEAANFHNLNKNNLYHNWVRAGARGNIKLNHLRTICDDVDIDWKPYVKKVSLYNGKTMNFPGYLNKDFLYFAGLVAGDGDLQRNKSGSVSVRFSNRNSLLQEIFRNTVKEQFNLKCDVTMGNSKRPEASRFHSTIIGEVLNSLGVPNSPKSNKLSMSPVLLHLKDELLAEYIAGLYDSDGSIYERKGIGSNCIDFTTCSEELARQLQLVLIRYGIHSRLRNRKPTAGKIKGKYNKWVLEIRGAEHIVKFSNFIPLRHPLKISKLLNLTSIDKKAHTNVDLLPGVGKRLKDFLRSNSISLRKVKWHENLSRKGLKKILEDVDLEDSVQLHNFKVLADSDIIWDKVREIKVKAPDYEYVYDLTVKDSHNFVVDGVLVHNTAAVVKDEFLKGWSLEAGAMVLSNKGTVCIDEIEKMNEQDRSTMHEAMEQQCYSPDLELTFVDGSKRLIGDFVDELIEKNKCKVEEGIDCEILPFDGGEEILTTDFETIYPTKIRNVSRRRAPDKFVKIKLNNGREIKVTSEHPCWVVKDGEITTIKAENLKRGTPFPVISNLNTNVKGMISSKVEWDRVSSIEFVKNKDEKWVYDITIDGTHSFISNGMVLHNSVTISKANIQATLRAETTVLAAGNPKLGRFDPYTPIPNQIDISPALLSRFDVIFVIRDLPNRAQDEAIATHVLEEHKQGIVRDVVESGLLRKYIAYAKQKVKPKLTDEAIEEIKTFYIKLRSQPSRADSEVRPIAITARQLEGIIRLSEAHAKMRLSSSVTRDDAKRAIELVRMSLMQVGYDEETQSFDVDRVTTGITASKRGKIILVKEALSELEKKIGKLIPMEELEKELGGKISDVELEEAISRLAKEGDIFKPKKGFVQRI